MNKIKQAFIAATLVITGAAAGATLLQPAVYAGTAKESVLGGANATQESPAATPSIERIVKSIVNILLFVLGAIAVIMIVIGGIKYTTSNGNAEQIKSAKNTIMYAVIGIIVALLAYAIVNFVVTSLTATPATTP